jgi:hypothetical protein
MGNRAARLAACAVAAIAVAAAGCRRSPVAAHAADAGGEQTGAPSVSDAAREPLDAGVETPTDASTDADHDLDASDASDTGDAPPADAPVDQPNTGDGPVDFVSADGPAEVAGNDAPPNADAPSDRTLADRSDVRPEDQPCGAQGFNCAPFACDVARGACKSTCATNDDCVTGKMCNPVGLCGFKEDLACSSDGECLSGHCAQGVCCATACVGPCRSCALPGSFGTCTTVPRGALDPSATCGAGATCNGRGGCVPSTCVADTDCGDLYLCTAGHCVPCNATCVSSAACVAPAVCIMRNFCTYCGVPDGGTGL